MQEYLFLKRSSLGRFLSIEGYELKLNKEVYLEIKDYITYVLRKMNSAWEEDIFEPTFSDCNRCFVKSWCKYVV